MKEALRDDPRDEASRKHVYRRISRSIRKFSPVITYVDKFISEIVRVAEYPVTFSLRSQSSPCPKVTFQFACTCPSA